MDEKGSAMKPKLLTIGHSHAGAMARAFRENFRVKAHQGTICDLRLIPLFQEPFQPNIVEEGGAYVVSDLLKRKIRSIFKTEAPDLIIASLGGNEWNAMALAGHPTPFDFHLPESGVGLMAEYGHEGHTLILAEDLIEELRARFQTVISPLAAEISAVADCEVIFLVPPPPIPSIPHLLAHASVFERRFRIYGVSPKELRLKVWHLHRRVLCEVAEALGHTIMDAPRSTLDDGGYLAEPYWATDPTHGNTAFGLEVLEMAVAHAKDLMQGGGHAASL